jgi:CO/xanthine dehydrogenase Mo-binding subunit
MDYLLPTALDVPAVTMRHLETPAPMNPLGIKGVGEAGCIPTGAAFAQAVEDALADYELEVREIPLSPNLLFEMLRDAPRRAPSPAGRPTPEPEAAPA